MINISLANGEKIMGCKSFPQKVFIFDMHKTLDCASHTPDEFVLPSKEIFTFLQNLDETWVGCWSGMYPWMQLQKAHSGGIKPDFVMHKHDGFAMQDSIIRIWKKEGTQFFVIGDDEEDKLFAYQFHFTYFDKRRFWEMYKNNMLIDLYQDLLYPDRTIEGFRGTSKTWDKIKDIIDFKEKVVLDIGCNAGYLMIQSLRNGANSVYGIDLNELHNTTKLPENVRKPLDVAKEILELWNFDTNRYCLIQDNWESYDLNSNYKITKVDIIFCMNVAHYWKDLEKGLNKLFNLSPETIIFEITLDDIVKKIIKNYNYKIIFNEKSHWNGKDTIIIKKQ